MATDSGMLARLEAWFVEQLTALEHDGKKVFKTVDHWRGQIGLDAGGVESFDQFAPYAFVAFSPTGPERAGGYDLNRKITITVAIGQTSKAAGIARIGDANHPGISLIHTLVINLFEGQHPGDGFTCDEFYFISELQNVNHPKRFGMQLFFSANYLPVS